MGESKNEGRELKRTTNLTELNKLEAFLKEHGVDYERVDIDGEWNEFVGDYIGECHQITVLGKRRKRKWDAICHYGSFGHSRGLLEIMGTIVRAEAKEKVEGWLTADDIIQRIRGSIICRESGYNGI